MVNKRFLFVLNRYLPAKSGSEILTSQIAEKMVSMGHSVDVFAFDSLTDFDYVKKRASLLKEEKINNVKITRFPLTRFIYHDRIMNMLEKRNIMTTYTGRRGLFSLPMINALKRTIKDYDVIVSGVMPFTGVICPAMEIAKRLNKKIILLPLIHFGHISDKTDMKNFNESTIRPEQYKYEYFSDEAMKIYDLSDVIITQGIFEENYIKQNFNSHFVRINPSIKIPENFEIKNKKEFIISTLANHSFEKGIETTLNAFKLVKKEAPYAKLIIAGYLDEKYKCMFKKIGGVELMNSIDEEEKNKFFFNSDIFVLPSIAESLGIVTLEAHAHGVPTINAFCSGSMQIVKNRVNGFLVPFQDYLLIYEYIMSIYKDRALLEKMKMNARETATGQIKSTEGYSNGGFSSERQDKQIKNLLDIL